MNDAVFGRLQDIWPRDAWSHEAHRFTPWLAENIDQLAAVIGIPLELTGKEVPIESFAADILARNPQDDTVVLIENQLEATDHTHLGQIMTYLAGLEAQTVVWIAPTFREPHLSAIRWLNEHTAENFSFFAIRLRVVRIGDSPFAPVFEVLEKPNDWERRLKQATRPAGSDPQTETRRAFWDFYADRHPEIAPVKPEKGWNAYFPVAGDRILLSVYIAQKTCGIYLRAPWSGTAEDLAQLLAPHADALQQRLGTEMGGAKGHFFSKGRPPGFGDRADWPVIVDWFETERRAYQAAITELIGTEA